MKNGGVAVNRARCAEATRDAAFYAKPPPPTNLRRRTRPLEKEQSEDAVPFFGPISLTSSSIHILTGRAADSRKNSGGLGARLRSPARRVVRGLFDAQIWAT